MRNRSVQRFVAVQLCAVAAVLPLLAAVSIAGYVVYGSSVPSNFLLALPPTRAGLLAQASIIPVVLGIYPLCLYPVTIALTGFLSGGRKANAQESLLNDGDVVPESPSRC